MNWQGLFNWSLQYTDGTRPSEFKPMEEETKKWLKSALESLVVDEIELMKKSSEILSRLEDGSPEDQKSKEEAAEVLLSPIENLECANNLVKIDGFKHIIRCLIGSQYLTVKKTCATIFASCVQNNPPVQQYAVDHSAVEGLTEIIKVEKDVPLKEQYVGCLSSLIRGEFLPGKERFMDAGGVEVVHGVLLARESVRIVKKCLLMLSDVLYNTRRKGSVRFTELVRDAGVIDTLQGLLEGADTEMSEMIQMVFYNSQVELNSA